MTQIAQPADPEVRALADQFVRFALYVVRWVIRRYALDMKV